MRIATGVTLIESNGQWRININQQGAQKDLASLVEQHKCSAKTAGVQLIKVVLYALPRAVVADPEALRAKANRQMPIILLKDFLFKVAGPCTSCKGRGCTACNQMGVV